MEYKFTEFRRIRSTELKYKKGDFKFQLSSGFRRLQIERESTLSP